MGGIQGFPASASRSAVSMPAPCFPAVEMQPRIAYRFRVTCSERSRPDIFCWVLAGRRSLSALCGYPHKAERDVRPVKVQMRTSGGCWRTLAGLADFAVVQSYLSTAGKWGIDALDALTQLFGNGPWLPPATAPP